ncbi:MAG: hypothetical protein A4E57_01087 [Syntrophorhabdaceae bacterium PtaU1.Bin034]|nr:MAG: hypothetical protein A4E57_01087 [Syntrophorhabdaceae bacterium PtaU1.Bin034]
MEGEQIMKYQNRQFPIIDRTAPPNPFFALKCSTSDPAKVKLLPLQPDTSDVPAMFAREGNSPGLEREQLSLGKSLRPLFKQNDLVGFMPTETNCATAPMMPELAARKFNSGSGGQRHGGNASDGDGL